MEAWAQKKREWESTREELSLPHQGKTELGMRGKVSGCHHPGFMKQCTANAAGQQTSGRDGALSDTHLCFHTSLHCWQRQNVEERVHDGGCALRALQFLTFSVLTEKQCMRMPGSRATMENLSRKPLSVWLVTQNVVWWRAFESWFWL